MTEPTQHPLGRIYLRDERDDAHQIARLRTAAAPLAEEPIRKTWEMPSPLDQGSEPMCVGFCGQLWENGEPHFTTDAWDAATIYWAARERDGLPDDLYPEGTTLRGALQFLQEDGRVGEYLWAATIEDIVWWLLHRGPVWAGTSWYSGMDEPDAEGILHPTGVVRGGHAYLLVGVDTTDGGWITMQNSWGSWGFEGSGQAWLTFADMAFLLANQGEAVGVDEVPK